MRDFLKLVLVAAAAAIPASAAVFEAPVDLAGWKVVRGRAAADKANPHGPDASLRVERSDGDPDACVASPDLPLALGATYKLTCWIRTEGLGVTDLDRSPIATGATITMDSMPYDVHAASVGGTSGWTQVSLRFVASRTTDRILLEVARGGDFRGRAWFGGVSLKEATPEESWPAREAVVTFGPAYRYPREGWIYLHIEGKPYERGYQHGYLMAKEIPEYLNRCAFNLSGSADEQAWNTNRTTADALFLRGFDSEILEEMKGIADGANAGGARWMGRKVDVVDIVLANTTVELSCLQGAMGVTAKGLEGRTFEKPDYGAVPPKGDSPAEHCSAFAATGPATRDGKMVIGHVTWWPQSLAEQTNVMLDIVPQKGHRMLIQSYPGGIESGTDWYQNDAGIVLTETTLDQTPFNPQGTPVAFRARLAIQYSATIDDVVRLLGTSNNGLYTNEWIIGDAKTDEIAMYELGTRHTKLWRSSKNEWFGNTPGFYWGDNNAKDLDVNLEYHPDPQGTSNYIPYVPEKRDLAWTALYGRFKGRIDEQFGFLAYDSAPLIGPATMDAKVVTSAMASHMMVWAEFGRPNESVWTVRDGDKVDRGLYPGTYSLFSAQPSASLRAAVAASEQNRLKSPRKADPKKPDPLTFAGREDLLWKGWVLPQSGSDTWFVAGAAGYRSLLLGPDVAKDVELRRTFYRGYLLSASDAVDAFRMETVKGELFLDEVRLKLGDDRFLKTMRDFFAANSTKAVSADAFLKAAGVPFDFQPPGDGPAYVITDIWARLASTVIVYGTACDSGTNRFAAEARRDFYRNNAQIEVPVYKDFEATAAVLAHKDVIFIGRPESNSALAAWSRQLGLDYAGAAFRLDGKTYASERDSLAFASTNPEDAGHMVLVLAGNSPLSTAQSLLIQSRTPHAASEDGVVTGP